MINISIAFEGETLSDEIRSVLAALSSLPNPKTGNVPPRPPEATELVPTSFEVADKVVEAETAKVNEVVEPPTPKAVPAPQAAPAPEAPAIPQPKSPEEVRKLKIVDLRTLGESLGFDRKTPRKELDQLIIDALFPSDEGDDASDDGDDGGDELPWDDIAPEPAPPAPPAPKAAAKPAPKSAPEPEPEPEQEDDFDAQLALLEDESTGGDFVVDDDVFLSAKLATAFEDTIRILISQGAGVDQCTKFVSDNINKYAAAKGRTFTDAALQNVVVGLFDRVKKKKG